MSWLARSLVNSLRGDHGDSDGEDDEISPPASSGERSRRATEGDDRDPVEPETPTRGVKEDISELTKTLTRQFWGVASFLAPPPETLTPPPDPDPAAADLRHDPESSGGLDDAEASESPRLAGIRSDFAEIGGKFRSGISMLSSTKAVTEISKIASTLLPFGSDEDEDEDEEEDEAGSGAVGVTDEVLAFVRNVSMHPETWLDFPLLPDDEDSDDFYMSDAQQEHTLAIERFAPRLAALRIELCPSHMSEGYFWKIYFVLLHPRLNKQDAEILSTPQIVVARAMLQDVQNQTRRNPVKPEDAAISIPLNDDVQPSPDISPDFKLLDQVPLKDFEMEKHTIQATEVEVIEKSVIEEGPPIRSQANNFRGVRSEISIQGYEEDGDEWLEEEVGGTVGAEGISIPLYNEDTSFSDLEDDVDDCSGSRLSKADRAVNSPTKSESGGWVQLSRRDASTEKGGASSGGSQTKEPNDWLDVDMDAD